MAFLDWSTTASNNTTIGGIGIQGTNAVSNFDDAFRTLMAESRSGVDGKIVYAAKTTNYTAVANDNNAYLRFTSAATLSLTAAATLGANWHVWVHADGADVTVDPNSSEQINGATTMTIRNGEMALIVCTGAAFFAKLVNSATQGYAAKSGSYTALDTDSGSILRFTAAATLSIDTTANLRSNWFTIVWADGGRVVIDPASTNTINGALSLPLEAGQYAFVFRDSSTTFRASVYGNTLSGTHTQGYLFGLTLSNNSTDPTNDIDIAGGAAAAGSFPTPIMTLSSAITKRLDAAWASGTGNGGLDTGAVADGTYHVFLIARSDTNAADVLFSTSATAPTMPSDYDLKRRIGSIIRVSGAILAFVQDGDHFMLQTPRASVDTTNPGTSAVTATLGVPTGIRVRGLGVVITSTTDTSQTWNLYVSDLSVTDQTPSLVFTTLSGQTLSTAGTYRQSSGFEVFTNTSAQIRYRTSASPASFRVLMTTYGWVDTRGQVS